LLLLSTLPPNPRLHADLKESYLTSGPYYGVLLQDQEKTDAEFTTIIKIMFHDEAHRKVASSYWTFWLSQQSSPKTARAIDIGMYIMDLPSIYDII